MKKYNEILEQPMLPAPSLPYELFDTSIKMPQCMQPYYDIDHRHTIIQLIHNNKLLINGKPYLRWGVAN